MQDKAKIIEKEKRIAVAFTVTGFSSVGALAAGIAFIPNWWAGTIIACALIMFGFSIWNVATASSFIREVRGWIRQEEQR